METNRKKILETKLRKIIREEISNDKDIRRGMPLNSELKSYLRAAQSTQSIDVQFWASNILKKGYITQKDLGKLLSIIGEL